LYAKTPTHATVAMTQARKIRNKISDLLGMPELTGAA